MITTDPIADMLTRIKNAQMVGHAHVSIPTSKVKLKILSVLKKERFIEHYTTTTEENNKSTTLVKIRYYSEHEPVIKGIKRISTPGLRRYIKTQEIQTYRGGMGVAIISTNEGLLTGYEAKKRGLGGEFLLLVW